MILEMVINARPVWRGVFSCEQIDVCCYKRQFIASQTKCEEKCRSRAVVQTTHSTHRRVEEILLFYAQLL
jgi:hypothetical protein